MSKVAPDVLMNNGARILRWRGTPLPGQVMVFLHGLPGHGGSDFHDPKDYTVPKFANWIADVLAREGIRNPILIGHSMGGRVALESSYSGVIQPSQVVVVDVSPDVKEGEDLDDAIETHLQMLAAGATNLTSFRQKIGMRMPLADKEILAEIWGALEAMGCPGTIIRGAFSSALDAQTAQKMARTLRHSSGCLTVPKAGHAIAFEQPVALAKAIAQGP